MKRILRAAAENPCKYLHLRRSLRKDEITALAAGVKTGEQVLAQFGGRAPGMSQVNLAPVTGLINKELVRRKMDPASVKPLNIPMPFGGAPGMPGGTNMGR